MSFEKVYILAIPVSWDRWASALKSLSYHPAEAPQGRAQEPPHGRQCGPGAAARVVRGLAVGRGIFPAGRCAR